MALPVAPRPAALLCLAAALWPGPSRAGPGDWVAGPAAGPALLRLDGAWCAGLQGGIEGRYGLGEAWAVRSSVEGGWYRRTAVAGGQRSGAGDVSGGTAAVGLVYAWDVVRVVPFADASLALSLLRGAGAGDGGFIGLQLGGGLGYLLDRRWALSGSLRYHHLGLSLNSDQGLSAAPWAVAALLRLERHF